MNNDVYRSRKTTERLAACGCCTTFVPNKDPIPDGPCTGKNRSKFKAPKKTKCRKGGHHEWVHESTEERGVQVTHRAGYWGCEDCKSAQESAKDAWRAKWKGFANMGEKPPFSVYYHVRCEHHNLRRPFTVRIKRSLCVKCGEEVEKRGKPIYDDGQGEYYHGVKRHIPSRAVVC